MTELALKLENIRFDLKDISESRILSEYITSKLYKLLLGALTSEVQELSDAIADLIEYRTLAKAKGKNLDAIGHIVGCPRQSLNYDTPFWFTPDLSGSGADQGNWWVHNSPQAVVETMDDDTYRKWIWMKILKNHNLFSSKPEIENSIADGIGETVAIQRTGMIKQEMYVTTAISTTNKNLLSYSVNTQLTDNEYLFAYPAATEVEDVTES